MFPVSKRYNVHLLEKLLFVNFPPQVQCFLRTPVSPKGEKKIRSWTVCLQGGGGGGEIGKAWRNDEIAKWRNGTKSESQSYKILLFH